MVKLFLLLLSHNMKPSLQLLKLLLKTPISHIFRRDNTKDPNHIRKLVSFRLVTFYIVFGHIPRETHSLPQCFAVTFDGDQFQVPFWSAGLTGDDCYQQSTFLLDGICGTYLYE